MNFKDLLNTDHEAIIQWLLHAFRWWVDELMGMAPPEWRDRLLKRNFAIAELTDRGILYRKQSGEALATKPRGSVKLLIPAGEVLTREADLPIMPASDLKRMVALDLDRLTPFRAEQVLFDMEVVSRDEERGRQQVVIGVVPRGAAVKAVEQARSNDLEPAFIGVAPRSGQRWNLNFLPALRETQGGTGARRRAVYWWVAASVLLVFNLFMLNYRDTSRTSQLRESVESQQGPVSVAMRLRDKVQKEAARRADLLKQQKQSAPLPVLDAVSQALPDGAWVERFEWNGKTVHIRGFRKEMPNMLAKIEASPQLRNARSLTADPHAAMSATGSFDLSAEREGDRVR